MSKLILSRTEFREAVFKRDKNKCIVCGDPAKDAHHIIERKLFKDGGYYLNNGASLCSECHLLAEETYISVQLLCRILGVKPILPEGFDPNLDYTKWGDIILSSEKRMKGELFNSEQVQKVLPREIKQLYMDYIKYPKTMHLPWSENLQNDDRRIETLNGFIGQEVVVTEKLDGENTTGYKDGFVHARSRDSNNHPTRNWVKNFLGSKLHYLPDGWRLCGENCYAKHSIHYHNLKSYFYLFSIWQEDNYCLDWDEMCEWAEMLSIEVVPVIYRGIFSEKDIDLAFLKRQRESEDELEGYVVRPVRGFYYGTFPYNVAKFVRKNHVRTSEHWLSEQIIKNEIKECQ